jgi:hypothetical protein
MGGEAAASGHAPMPPGGAEAAEADIVVVV